MTPRTRALSVVLVVAATCALALAWPERPADVLLIVMDTVGADRCSVTGHTRPTTPCLEDLARESVVFDDAWSPSSWTVPAHAALFTGRSPSSLGYDDAERFALPAETPTLAGVLAAEGWATGCFTSSPWIAEHTQLTRGFEFVDPAFRDPARANARSVHEAALAWMVAQRRAGRRFFAFVNDLDAHTPRTPPPEALANLGSAGVPEHALFAASRATTVEMTRAGLATDREDPEVVAAHAALYDAEIRGLDAEIGRLVASMRRSGLLDRTLVVVTSDHGEGLGRRRGWIEHGVFLDRRLLRVPLVVRPPGGVPARRVAHPVELADLFPTVLDAARVRVPAGAGRRHLLRDDAPRTPVAAEVPRNAFVAQMREVAPDAPLGRVTRSRRSIYDGRHHLIVDDTGASELYDVVADPDERRDLAGAQPSLVAELRRRLDGVSRP